MSLEPKHQKSNFYQDLELKDSKKVNLNDLMSRLNREKKDERRSNLILSAAAISAVTVFGIILTL